MHELLGEEINAHALACMTKRIHIANPRRGKNAHIARNRRAYRLPFTSGKNRTERGGGRGGGGRKEGVLDTSAASKSGGVSSEILSVRYTHEHPMAHCHYTEETKQDPPATQIHNSNDRMEGRNNCGSLSKPAAGKSCAI